jgi:hypothetical protein
LGRLSRSCAGFISEFDENGDIESHFHYLLKRAYCGPTTVSRVTISKFFWSDQSERRPKTPFCCSQFCSSQIWKRPQETTKILSVVATPSTTITYDAQNSTNFSTNENLLCEQGVADSNPATSTNFLFEKSEAEGALSWV